MNFPVLILIRKTVASIRNNGLKYTAKKIILRQKNNSDYQKDYALYSGKRNSSTDALTEPFNENDIRFSILVPLYNTPETFLRELIDSVRNQVFQNWELCLADGSDTQHGSVKEICEEYQRMDSRIRFRKLNENQGISVNSNACAQMASGEFLVLLDHDDLLSPCALAENYRAITASHPDILYSDEDHLSTDGKHINPFFKPDWSPDLLNCQMYAGHLLVFRRSLFEETGGFRKEYDGSQDYDLLLRMSERTDKIVHLPYVLYTWRDSAASTSSNPDAKPYAHDAGLRALNDHLSRVYNGKAAAQDGDYTFVYDTRFQLDGNPRISIILPMKDKWELTDQCIKSILEKSTYQNYEILIMNNRSEEEETLRWFDTIVQTDSRIKVIPADIEFNWSAINNLGVSHASGEIFVFLNNDTLIISPDWLERLAENALRHDIGVVGGLLLYPDNTIQHAGVVVGMGGWADHVFKGMNPIHYSSPFVSPVLSRDVLAVTGACMAVSRKHYELIGKFDEEFIICGSDVDYCIRAHDAGLFNLYNAKVKLYHLESKSRDSYIPEIDFEKSAAAYAPFRENGDPFYNRNLDLNSVQPKISRPR